MHLIIIKGKKFNFSPEQQFQLFIYIFLKTIRKNAKLIVNITNNRTWNNCCLVAKGQRIRSCNYQ